MLTGFLGNQAMSSGISLAFPQRQRSKTLIIVCGSGTGTLPCWRIQHVVMVVAGRETLSELPSQAACFDPHFQLWQASAEIEVFPV